MFALFAANLYDHKSRANTHQQIDLCEGQSRQYPINKHNKSINVTLLRCKCGMKCNIIKCEQNK